MNGCEMNDEHNNKNRQEHHRKHGHKGRGPSSAWLHEPKIVFGYLPIKSGDIIADLGCGAGDYTLAAAKIVGPNGRVFAFDKWQYLIDALSEKAESEGLKNITALETDITATLPIQDSSLDIVFIATVLHIFKLSQVGPSIFAETSRALKPKGCLAIVECKKEEQSFGPPKEMRNAPEDVESVVVPCGFRKVRYTDLGYNYMIQFLLE